jgi:hypothetical protein
MGLFDGKLGNLMDKIDHTPAMRQARIDFPEDRVDDRAAVGKVLMEDKCYFNIIINEMFLKDRRKKTRRVDPMVLSLTEFIHDNNHYTVPNVLGRSVLRGHFTENIRDEGIVISNALVAGPYPYRGGTLKTTIVLCEIEREDYANKMLNIVEQAAGIVPAAAHLTTYMKLAGMLYDGFLGILGSDGTYPIVGNQKSTNPDVGIPLVSGYYALINRDESELDEGTFFVVNRRLVRGKDMASAKPYRDADFVLYSIVPSTERTDEDQFSFFPTWKEARKLAASLDAESWKSAWVRYFICREAIMSSPDLIEEHKDTLDRRFQEELQDRIGKSKGLAIKQGIYKPPPVAVSVPADLSMLKSDEEAEDARPPDDGPRDEGPKDEVPKDKAPMEWDLPEQAGLQEEVHRVMNQMRQDRQLL